MKCLGYFSYNYLDDEDVLEKYKEYDYYLRITGNSLVINKVEIIDVKTKNVEMLTELENGDFDGFYSRISKILSFFKVDKLMLLKIKDLTIDRFYKNLKERFDSIDFIYFC